MADGEALRFFFRMLVRRGIAAAAVLLGFWGATAHAQMSPGDLSQAHKDLEGPLKCVSCHAFGAGAAQLKCLDCHEEIRRRLEEKRGYHARVVKGTLKQASQDCARCHAEHNGRQHQLVRWRTPKARFDHKEAGWALEGKHAPLACEKCHNASKISPEDKATLKRSDLGKSYLGLSQKCTNCHVDEHHNDLGANCLRCHNQETWKAPPGFSHDKSAYTLTGLHQKVGCEKCHKRMPPQGGHVQYKNFGFFETCKSCHKDPHGGSFAGDCQRCHSTNGWKPARPAEGGFDHGKTEYPLKGKHAAVECKKCHKTENFKAKVPHERCIDCHKDQHNGQFLKRDGGECGACHTETGWKPASFTAKDHAKTRYPLLGKHATVACAECHKGTGAATNYHPEFVSCRNCHADRHRGQFAAAPHENRCERCHAEQSWKQARYTPADHLKSKMPLTGAHVAVSCVECHQRAANPEETKFRFGSTRCAECHETPHGTLAEKFGSCENCHTTRRWKETGPFDHSTTGFALTGKHRGATCTGCHKPEIPGGRKLITFRGTTQQCGACHADVHEGQFQTATERKPDCGRCHTTSNWNPTGFDHQKHSTFSLAGAHELVPCWMCHANRREVGTRKIVIYRGTPKKCEECHR